MKKINCKRDQNYEGPDPSYSILYQWIAIGTLGIWSLGIIITSYPHKPCHCCLVSMSIQEGKTNIGGDWTQKSRHHEIQAKSFRGLISLTLVFIHAYSSNITNLNCRD